MKISTSSVRYDCVHGTTDFVKYIAPVASDEHDSVHTHLWQELYRPLIRVFWGRQGDGIPNKSDVNDNLG